MIWQGNLICTQSTSFDDYANTLIQKKQDWFYPEWGRKWKASIIAPKRRKQRNRIRKKNGGIENLGPNFHFIAAPHLNCAVNKGDLL